MTCYIARYKKKKERLEFMEDKLRRLIARGGIDAVLLKAAAEVAAARVRVLRSDRSRAVRDAVKTAEFNDRIREAESVPAEAVLAEYRTRAKG